VSPLENEPMRSPRSPLVVMDWGFFQSVPRGFVAPAAWHILLPDVFVHEIADKTQSADQYLNKFLDFVRVHRDRVWLARLLYGHDKAIRQLKDLCHIPATRKFREVLDGRHDLSSLIRILRGSEDHNRYSTELDDFADATARYKAWYRSNFSSSRLKLDEMVAHIREPGLVAAGLGQGDGEDKRGRTVLAFDQRHIADADRRATAEQAALLQVLELKTICAGNR
jgi:hypothetical protein